MKMIDQLDSVYTRTLDDPATDADRKIVLAAQKEIAAKCDGWLATDALTPETRSNFTALRKHARETIAEVERGEDVLLHWHVQRDLLERLFK